MEHCTLPYIYQTLRKNLDQDTLVKVLDDLLRPDRLQIDVQYKVVDLSTPPEKSPETPPEADKPAAKAPAKRAPRSVPIEDPPPPAEPKEKLFFTPAERAEKEAPAAPAPAPPAPPAPSDVEPEVTLAEVKTAINVYVSKVGRENAAQKVASLLTAYDATKLSELDPSVYGDFITDVSELIK